PRRAAAAAARGPQRDGPDGSRGPGPQAFRRADQRRGRPRAASPGVGGQQAIHPRLAPAEGDPGVPPGRDRGVSAMSDPTSGSGRDPVEQLLESFLARWRRGERPNLEEYAARCPERADEIRELFPALVEMEQLKPAVEAVTGPLKRLSSRPEAASGPAT